LLKNKNVNRNLQVFIPSAAFYRSSKFQKKSFNQKNQDVTK